MNTRSTLFLMAAVVSLLFASCDKSETLTADEGFKQVTFSLSAFNVEQESMTRADNSFSATPSRLLVLDVVNGAVMQTLERTTATIPEGASSGLTHADNVLSDLSLTLTYGQHDIYLLAAVSPYVSYNTADMRVLWNIDNRPSYTWAKKVTVNVSQASADAQEVTLPLVISRIDLICNDAQDPAATKMQISGQLCWTLDLLTMNGIALSSSTAYSIAIPNTTAGKTFAAYTFVPTSGNIANLTFTALKTVKNAQNEDVDSEITSHTLPNVPVTIGYITRYTGLFYSNTQGFSISTVNTWTGVIDQTY